MKEKYEKKTQDSEDLALRPRFLNEYIGQNDLKQNLKIFIGAALKRNETLDHCLFYGPPGLGKTTIAHIIANEMKTKIRVVSAPCLEKPGDLASILIDLSPGEILFIDEIHRLPKIVEEILYQAMEDYSLSIVISKDKNAQTMDIDIAPFTLIGATTKSGNLSSPLRSRFGIIDKINYYSIEELKDIILRSAKVFKINIEIDAALEIAKRSRGTPRIANILFKRARDFSMYYNKEIINIIDAKKAFNALRIDNIGLNEMDIKYLKTIQERFNGGPAGIESLAASIGEDKANLEDIYEPYLVQIGYIDRTAKGRILTKTGKEYLNMHHKQKLYKN